MTPWNWKKHFFNFVRPYVVVVVCGRDVLKKGQIQGTALVCGNDSFRKNYLIEMRFGTLYRSPKRKDEFVNQLYDENIDEL